MQNLGINVFLKGRNMIRLFEGLMVTARIALIAIIIGSLLGIVLGVVWTSKSKWSNLTIATRLVLSFQMLYRIIGVELIEVSHVVVKL